MDSSNDPTTDFDFSIQSLGPRKLASPYKARRYVSDDERVLHDTSWLTGAEGERFQLPRSPGCAFEVAGPRNKTYFDPINTRCAGLIRPIASRAERRLPIYLSAQ